MYHVLWSNRRGCSNYR